MTPESPRLVGNQKVAVEDLENSIFLSAGAGSGKTRVLVERYIRLLDTQRASVGQIVAFTFTEKAAKEMRDRIRQACDKRIIQASSPKSRSRWRRHKRDLENARISTIHGFCTRILRENAVAAGIDPRFVVLDDAEAHVLLSRCVEETLSELLAQEDADAVAVVAEFGLSDTRAMLGDIIVHRDVVELAGLSDPGAQMPATEVLESLQLEAVRQARKVLCTAPVSGAHKLLMSLTEIDPTDKLAQSIDRVLEAASALMNSETAATLYPHVGTLAKARYNMGAQDKWPDKDTLAAARDAVKCIKQAISDNVPDVAQELTALDERADDLAKAVRRLFDRILPRYEQAKGNGTQLDFLDLELCARALLRDNASVRNRYRDTFKHVMVDEFQDTNILQKEIIWALAGQDPLDLDSPPVPGRLFMVGDAKQSIYRFRRADVSVFNRTQEQLSAAGQCNTLRLKKNFRSAPDLMDVFNCLFSHEAVMGTGEPVVAYEARYEAMAAVRERPNRSYAAELLLVRAFEDEATGKTTKTSDLRDTEARCIAERIEAMVSGKEAGIVAEPDGVRYGDIAILLRSMTDVHIYERALREAEIPYYVIAGQGFYRRQEVLDLLNCLRAIYNPLDEIALAAVLRSPLFSLSDETLYWLCEQRDAFDEAGTPLWQALLQVMNSTDPGHLKPNEHAKAQRAAEILSELRRQKEHLRISELLNVVVERTGATAAQLTQFMGKQRASNIHKLIDIARRFDGQRWLSLADFIAYVSDLTMAEVREGEAPLEGEEDDVVKIMTIHKAKGLEWPVVIVPDIGRKLVHGADRAWILQPGHGLGLRLRDADGKRQPTVRFNAISNKEQAMETAEARRLLYVACTRAQDYLILSGSVKKKPPKGDDVWLNWLQEVCDLESADTKCEISLANGVSIRFETRTAEERSGRVVTGKPMPARYQSALLAGSSIEAPEDAELRRRLERQVQPVPAGERIRFSVTELARLHTCPRQHFLKHVQEVPEYRHERLRRHVRGRLSPRDKGTIAHRILQRLDAFGQERLEELISSAIREGGRQSSECGSLVEEFKSMVEWFRTSDVGQRCAQAETIQSEAAFVLHVDGAVLEGQIDKILRTRSGSYELIDFKTGHPDDFGESDASHLQLRIYAFAVHQLFGGWPTMVTLVFPQERREIAVSCSRDEHEISQTVVQLLHEARLGDDTPLPGPHCRQCGYVQLLCPQGRRWMHEHEGQGAE